MDCYEGPYRYLVTHGWNSWHAVRALAANTTSCPPVIKLRGPDRDKIGVSSLGLLVRHTSVSAADFFAAFGVRFEEQRKELCRQTAPTCEAILAR